MIGSCTIPWEEFLVCSTQKINVCFQNGEKSEAAVELFLSFPVDGTTVG